jgi:YD repeat-containing protein
MTDGTGTTTYTYDQIDRLTESKDGHGNTIKYGYDLASEQTKITYPNGKRSNARMTKRDAWKGHGLV